jgi:hypothetical protein
LKRSTMMVVALLLSVAGAFAQERPPVAYGVASPMVFDAKGRQVGAVVTLDNTNNRATIMFEVDEGEKGVSVIQLAMHRYPNGRVGWSGGEVLYTLSNCAGDAYVVAENSFTDTVGVVDAEDNLLLGDTSERTSDVQLLLTESIKAANGVCIPQRRFSHSLVPMKAKLKMSDYAQPPFEVRNTAGRRRNNDNAN